MIRPGAFARTLRRAHARRSRFTGSTAPDLRIGWVETHRRGRARPARGRRDRQPRGRRGAALKRGAVTGLSASATAPRSFRRDGDGRELIEVELFEVSLVTHPMQHAARVHLIA